MIKTGSTWFLKGVIVLGGAAILAICVFALPPAIRATYWWGYRPILVGLYVPAIPFFFALYQTLKLLSYIDQNKAFSDLTVQALKKIKYCAIIISALFTVGMPYVFYAADRDDAPGVVVIGLVIIVASIAVATFAAVLQQLLREALAIKSENDLTV